MKALSPAFLAAMNASATAQVYVLLLTLDAPELAEPIRVCSDSQPTISNGETYQPYPFQIVLPGEDEDSSPEATLEIDNVARELVATVRTMTSLLVRAQLVLASQPDTVELDYDGMMLRSVTVTAGTISGTLTADSDEVEPYPSGRFTPADFPALF
jgi:hypothetical protein